MSAKDVLEKDGPEDLSYGDDGGFGPAPAARGPWPMVAVALLLGATLVLAASEWSARTLELRLLTTAAAAGLLVLLVALALRPAAPERRRRITLITAFVAGGATLLLVIAPVAVPQFGPRGTGLTWVAPAATRGAAPLAVAGDTAVLTAEDRLLFLRLGDGSVVAEVPLQPSDVATVVGDGVLVRTSEGFMRYDLAGRPTWPEPIDSHRILAYDEGVVALAFCAGGSCRVEGRTATGDRTWQLEVPYVALHRPDVAEYASTGLPSQLAIRTTGGPAESPRWALRSATGEPAGTLEGKAIRLIDLWAITLGGDDLGPCIVRLQNGPTEAVDCVSPWSIRVRNGLLVVEQPHGYVSVIRPGPVLGGGEPFETATAFGRTPDSDLGQHGRARLTGDVLEGWPWTPFVRTGAPPAWRSAPLPLAVAASRPVVSVVGSTVVVLGDATPGLFGTLGEESTLLAYDLVDGTELARIRLPRVAPNDLPGRAVPTGDGRVLLALPGRPPMLVGRN